MPPCTSIQVRPFDYLIAGTQCKRCGLRAKHSTPQDCVTSLVSVIARLKPAERHYKMVIPRLREVIGFMESDGRGAGEASRMPDVVEVRPSVINRESTEAHLL